MRPVGDVLEDVEQHGVALVFQDDHYTIALQRDETQTRVLASFSDRIDYVPVVSWGRDSSPRHAVFSLGWAIGCLEAYLPKRVSTMATPPDYHERYVCESCSERIATVSVALGSIETNAYMCHRCALGCRNTEGYTLIFPAALEGAALREFAGHFGIQPLPHLTDVQIVEALRRSCIVDFVPMPQDLLDSRGAVEEDPLADDDVLADIVAGLRKLEQAARNVTAQTAELLAQLQAQGPHYVIEHEEAPCPECGDKGFVDCFTTRDPCRRCKA